MHDWTVKVDTGDEFRFRPEFVTPFGFQDLMTILNPSKGATEPVTHHVELFATHATINENEITGTGRVRMTARMGFNEKASVYALVMGGWLPPGICPNNRFLVDRNVVSLLKQMAQRPDDLPPAQRDYWLRFFEDPEIMLNPLPFAFEGRDRRRPSKAEFIAEFEEGQRAIRAAMPLAQVTTYAAPHFDGSYALLESLKKHEARETTFLLEVVPIIQDRPGVAKTLRAENRVIEAARRHNVSLGSLVVVAALSCIYEGDLGISPARRVLKPSPAYGKEEAYNALADLRHLELKLAGAKAIGDGEFALCTADEGLALFWCGLPCALKEDGRTFRSQLTLDLFPRLNESGLSRLGNRLSGR